MADTATRASGSGRRGTKADTPRTFAGYRNRTIVVSALPTIQNVGAAFRRPRAVADRPYEIAAQFVGRVTAPAALLPLSLRGWLCHPWQSVPSGGLLSHRRESRQRVAENLTYKESAFLLRCPASSSPTTRLPHLPTAATRSGRCICHRQRSPRSPLRKPHERLYKTALADNPYFKSSAKPTPQLSIVNCPLSIVYCFSTAFPQKWAFWRGSCRLRA